MRAAGLPRWGELAIAAAALAIAAPVMLLCAIAVWCSSPGPVLFRQQRAGRGGQLFNLYKFRSMRTGAPGTAVTAANDARITAVGRWLRRSKLDELPQLFNLLAGDMSLVGYRPEVPRFVDTRNDQWRRILMERPGLVDPVALVIGNEERLLAANGAPDLETYYRVKLLPRKLALYSAYQAQRTWLSDLRTLVNLYKLI
jgi:lipopolysaccharide/colanic/teichoic acid biosynthesis glycosyltransferase